MNNTTIYSRKNLAPLIFEAFSYLQEKGLVVSLFRYASETAPNSGKENERLVRLDDGSGHKLTGLFLKASKESMLERNARRVPRWFETPFIINGQEYYLSSQWNASGDFQLTLPNLNYFLKECCRNESDGSTFSIYKSDDEFIFAQGKFEDNNEVLPQKSPDSKEHEIKQKPVLEEKVLPHQKIFFGAPGTGKSHKIDYDLFKDKDGNPIGKGIKEIPEERKFRTTFHPDYDYAQFMGAYKPQKLQNNDNGLLSEEQLAQRLSKGFPTNNNEKEKTIATALFGLQYFKSLKDKTMAKIVELSGVGNSKYIGATLSAVVKARVRMPDKENEISYSFVPQVFAKAYAAAWKLYLQRDSRDSIGASPLQNDSGKDIQVYLVIEEINRGNCAQIFGDIFQVLDRVGDGADKGFSQYSIDADCDFAEWLKTNDNGLKSVWSAYEEKVGDGKLKLPPNLNILATMNTSDQSLFPMDSAFKRRFDWEYVPISFTDEEGNEKEAAKYEIDIPDANGKNYLWKNFVEAVNKKILDLTESEDKQLGEFFIKPDSGNVISKERFLGKVMFYLWNEVCKDEHKNGSFFRAKINDKEDFFTFQDLYKKKDLLKLFMDELLKKE